jgi:type IV pilus assembly protein PilM
MFSFGKKAGPSLGLDINSQSINLIQLEKTKRGMEVVGFASMPSVASAVKEGLIIDPETIGQQVADLFAELGSKIPKNRCFVNVAVPGQSVIIRLLPVPTGMPEDELADVVRQEAINHIPFPLEEANLDWAVMPATERTEPDGVVRVDVILAAMQKSLVDSYWRVAEVAGCRLGSISISSLAAIKALALAGYFLQDDKLTMSVNLRQEGTDISVVKNGMPLFSRSVVLGIDSLSESISRSLDISIDESRELIPQAPILGVSLADQKLLQVAQIARTVLGDITDEVGRSLDFYRSQVEEVNISQIVLSGIGCEVPTVDRFFQNRLNIDTVVGDSFREFIDSTPLMEARKTSCTTAVGSAAEATWLPIATVDVDLNREGPSGAAFEGGEGGLPAIEVDTPWFKPALIVGVVALVAVLGVWVYISQVDIPRKQAEIQQLEADNQIAQSKLKNLPRLIEERDGLLRKKHVLQGIVNHLSPWPQVLSAVSDSCPDGVQIKKLEVSPAKITVTGTSTDFAKISHFAINLNGTNLATSTNIEMAKREQTDPRIIDFELNSLINPQAASQSPANLNPAQPQVSARPAAIPGKTAGLAPSN